MRESKTIVAKVVALEAQPPGIVQIVAERPADETTESITFNIGHHITAPRIGSTVQIAVTWEI